MVGMIRVAPYEMEPHNFNNRVRIPGLAFLGEMQALGFGPLPARFPWRKYWKRTYRQLYDAYGGVCAYLGIKFDRRSNLCTDHFLPRAFYPWEAYEWNNFRLADTNVNGAKGNHMDILDPFEIQDGWFQINFLDGSIHPANDLDDETFEKVQTTINHLHLDHEDFREMRLNRFNDCIEGLIKLEWLAEWAPFVHYELCRQDLVR
jgi:hypothetical protein